MKNLIEEIKGYEFSYAYDDFRKGFNSGLNVAAEVVNEHDIIVAPKSVKLSEIVDRLETIYFFDYNIHRVNNEIYIHEKGTTYHSDYMIEILGKKMTDIRLDYLCDETKWFYKLWIAETEIIDDLKELEK
jgi:hypothetical protein